MDKEQRAHEFALLFVQDRLRYTDKKTYEYSSTGDLAEKCARLYNEAFRAYLASNY